MTSSSSNIFWRCRLRWLRFDIAGLSFDGITPFGYWFQRRTYGAQYCKLEKENKHCSACYYKNEFNLIPSIDLEFEYVQVYSNSIFLSGIPHSTKSALQKTCYSSPVKVRHDGWWLMPAKHQSTEMIGEMPAEVGVPMLCPHFLFSNILVSSQQSVAHTNQTQPVGYLFDTLSLRPIFSNVERMNIWSLQPAVQHSSCEYCNFIRWRWLTSLLSRSSCWSCSAFDMAVTGGVEMN